VDDLDTRILRELIADVTLRSLQSDVRRSYAVIAKRLGIDEDTVRNRLRGLRETGFLREWCLGINPTVFGYQTSFIFAELHRTAEKDALLKKVAALPRVLWAVSYLGNSTGVLLSHPDQASLDGRLRSIRPRSGWKRFVVVNNTFPPVTARLTAVDWSIIRTLRRNPRMPFREIAVCLHLTARTVKRRLNRMIEQRALFVFPALDCHRLEGRILVTLAVFYSDPALKQDAEERLLSIFSAYYLFTPSPEPIYAAYAFLVPALAVADEIRASAEALPGVRAVSLRPIVAFENRLKDVFAEEVETMAGTRPSPSTS
jgi:DNA-binding Lrp family transcriptional regulator